MSEGVMSTIMIVDDAKAIRRAATMFLDQQGVNVVEAVDGFEALGKIHQSPPDLLFLDITMPRLDGYQVCLLLRSMPEFQDLPIIMLSGKDSPFDLAQGNRSGCTDYLTKPFKRETLLASVKKHLKPKS